jgi:glycerol-3-phosphate dehydrogenase (NAD(P)+)
MPERIAIIGGGTMGTVVSILLANKGCNVAFWHGRRSLIEALIQDRENRRYLPGHPIPPNVRFCVHLADALRDADMLVNAVPTQFMRRVWTEVKSAEPAAAPVTSVSKGIEEETLLRPTEILHEVLGADRGVCALSGPSIGPELAHCLPATLVAASPSEALAGRVRDLFSTEYLRIYTNTDLVGVEIAGAAKNVVAIAAGILDGLRCGDNAKAGLLTRGLVEITRLGAALGARPETFMGLAGIGDLITTAISPLGRNRRVGEQIGRGRKLAEVLSEMDQVAEGVASTKSLIALARRHGVEMPIAEGVHRVLFEDKDPITEISRLMVRQAKSETAGRPL